jgi:hypothetical protein
MRPWRPIDTLWTSLNTTTFFAEQPLCRDIGAEKEMLHTFVGHDKEVAQLFRDVEINIPPDFGQAAAQFKWRRR